MELLCNAPAHASVPERYVFPPEKRAALQLDAHNLHDDGVTLPVVDLHRAALAGESAHTLHASSSEFSVSYFQNSVIFLRGIRQLINCWIFFQTYFY
jgi:hypothetical protein